jgi:lipoprotein-releasing system ATP-binding protein
MIGRMLHDLHQQEKTILIVVTHSLELAKLFPRQLEMNEGRLIGETRLTHQQ